MNDRIQRAIDELNAALAERQASLDPPGTKSDEGLVNRSAAMAAAWGAERAWQRRRAADYVLGDRRQLAEQAE